MSKIIKKSTQMKGATAFVPRKSMSGIIPQEGGGMINKKVLDAKERADKIIEEASVEADGLRAEAKGILDRVNQEMEKAKRDGFARGHEEGISSVAEFFFALNAMKEKFYANAEPEVIKLVMAISEKVIGKIVHEHDAAIKSIIRQAIESSLGERITVRLNPEDHKIVSQDDMEFKDILDRTKRIVFKDDETIKKGGCVVETEIGTIDARLETQLKAIKKALQI
jgi:flagellar biosynthesis/type III secretory pathway protein FliH